jgi:hypothetical protein
MVEPAPNPRTALVRIAVLPAARQPTALLPIVPEGRSAARGQTELVVAARGAT